MDQQGASFQSIDEYIATVPENLRARLQELRATIQAAAPDAKERISYRMPTFTHYGNLVHFAAFRQHIGFYPTPSGIEAFWDEASRYGGTKGALHFPLNEPLPLDLVTKIVKFRVAENESRARAKARKPRA